MNEEFVHWMLVIRELETFQINVNEIKDLQELETIQKKFDEKIKERQVEIIKKWTKANDLLKEIQDELFTPRSTGKAQQ